MGRKTRPGRIYRQIKGKAYTRKEYMGGVPHSRITEFDIGDPKGDYNCTVHLIPNEQCKITHTSLEAARIAATRFMSKTAGNRFHLKIRTYPHVVLRENKIVSGAGADRISDGMRHAFGKPVGLAAKLKRDQILMTMRTTKDFLNTAKLALGKAGSKITVPCRVEIEPT